MAVSLDHRPGAIAAHHELCLDRKLTRSLSGWIVNAAAHLPTLLIGVPVQPLRLPSELHRELVIFAALHQRVVKLAATNGLHAWCSGQNSIAVPMPAPMTVSVAVLPGSHTALLLQEAPFLQLW